jgi:hypothetical protein
MRQLVSSTCVICQEPINYVREGRFCQTCRNAVHNRCMKPEIGFDAQGRCAACGADLAQAAALRQREKELSTPTRGSLTVRPVGGVRQLVNSTCVRCKQSITDILEGRFCESCKSPIHQRCMNPEPGLDPQERCAACGAELAREAAFTHADKHLSPSSRGPYPVSRVCPECGETGYKGVRPERLVAFTWDHVCKSCGTRYTPPTPTWASVVFILAGLFLGAFGGRAILQLAGGNLLAIPEVACEGFLGLLGVLAIIQGIRSLSNPGRA